MLEEGNKFIGSSAQKQSICQAKLVFDAVAANQASNPSLHLAYSYRIRKPVSYKCAFVEYINDDRVWSAGHYMLEALREKGVNDCILIVIRWMTNKEAEIGGRHFQLCKETASAAFDMYVKFTPQNEVD